MKAMGNMPNLTPLLARLHESHKLYALAHDRQPAARTELTAVVASLLDVKLSPVEQEMLADVMITLLRQGEMDLRRALADRLALMDNVPLRLILFLANDDIAVAEPVLRQSLVLTDLDLIYIIKSQGASYWQSIASRANISAQVVDTLADTRDEGTAIVLAQNERAILTDYALQILSAMAKENEDIARPLLARPDLPVSVARDIYARVEQSLRAHVRTEYGEVLAGSLEKILDDIQVEFVDSQLALLSEYMPTAAMMEAADKYAGAGLLNLQLIMETIRRGQISSFIAYFSKYSGLTAKRVHDMLLQTCPKGMAIACRAYGIQKGDFSNIYIMTHRMRSNGRMINHKEMLSALRYFDKIRPEVALRIVRSSEGITAQ